MTAYITRRLVMTVVTAVGVAVICYALLHDISPSPAYTVLGTKANPTVVRAWNKAHGFDKPEIVQIGNYLWALLHGHFGFSYKLDQSVGALLKEAAPRSAYLSGAGLILSLIIAIPLGIAQAVKRNSPGDYAATAINFTLYSMPIFFLGLLLIQFFALDIPAFKPEVSDQVTTFWQALTHPDQLFLPIITVTFIQVASYSRYMRSAALDALAQDYIRLARAKGLSEKAVLMRHLLRNSMIPMLTLIGLSIPALLAGNVIVEVLFNYPGLGMMFFTALGNEDYQVLLAYVIIGSLLTVLGNLMADVAITITDPRVRLG